MLAPNLVPLNLPKWRAVPRRVSLRRFAENSRPLRVPHWQGTAAVLRGRRAARRRRCDALGAARIHARGQRAARSVDAREAVRSVVSVLLLVRRAGLPRQLTNAEGAPAAPATAVSPWLRDRGGRARIVE